MIIPPSVFCPDAAHDSMASTSKNAWDVFQDNHPLTILACDFIEMFLMTSLSMEMFGHDGKPIFGEKGLEKLVSMVKKSPMENLIEYIADSYDRRPLKRVFNNTELTFFVLKLQSQLLKSPTTSEMAQKAAISLIKSPALFTSCILPVQRMSFLEPSIMEFTSENSPKELVKFKDRYLSYRNQADSEEFLSFLNQNPNLSIDDALKLNKGFNNNASVMLKIKNDHASPCAYGGGIMLPKIFNAAMRLDFPVVNAIPFLPDSQIGEIVFTIVANLTGNLFSHQNNRASKSLDSLIELIPHVDLNDDITASVAKLINEASFSDEIDSALFIKNRSVNNLFPQLKSYLKIISDLCLLKNHSIKGLNPLAPVRLVAVYGASVPRNFRRLISHNVRLFEHKTSLRDLLDSGLITNKERDNIQTALLLGAVAPYMSESWCDMENKLKHQTLSPVDIEIQFNSSDNGARLIALNSLLAGKIGAGRTDVQNGQIDSLSMADLLTHAANVMIPRFMLRIEDKVKSTKPVNGRYVQFELNLVKNILPSCEEISTVDRIINAYVGITGGMRSPILETFCIEKTERGMVSDIYLTKTGTTSKQIKAEYNPQFSKEIQPLYDLALQQNLHDAIFINDFLNVHHMDSHSENQLVEQLTSHLLTRVSPEHNGNNISSGNHPLLDHDQLLAINQNVAMDDFWLSIESKYYQSSSSCVPAFNQALTEASKTLLALSQLRPTNENELTYDASKTRIPGRGMA